MGVGETKHYKLVFVGNISCLDNYIYIYKIRSGTKVSLHNLKPHGALHGFIIFQVTAEIVRKPFPEHL